MNAEIGQGQGYEPGVGALLRASRLRCGEDLRDVAALLRIRHSFLEAIEEGRYRDLPGSAYAIGFVRTYAEHLGLDSEEVVRRFKTEAENLDRRSDLVFPSPMAERSTPGGAIILVGILLAAVAYGAWYVGTARQSFLDDLVSPLPDRLTAMLRGGGDVPPAPPPVGPGDVTNRAPLPAPAAPAWGPEPAKQGGPAGEAAATASDPVSAESPVGTPSAPPVQPEMTGRLAAPTPGPTTPVLAPTPPPAAASAPSAPAVPVAPPAAHSEPPAAVTSTPEGSSTSQAPTPPAASAPSEPQTAPRAEAPQQAALPAPPVVAPSPQPAPAATPAEPPAPPEATAAGTATQQPDSAPAVRADTAPRIVVRAKLDSWIQVRDGVARRLLVTRLLRAGETYEVPNQPSLSLLTGNAGGLEILVDGEPVPTIGEVGAVRRDVVLEADRLRAGTAVVD